jgi:hypothetical protein
MKNDGQWMFDCPGGMIGEGREQKSHFLALAMPDEARQPNAVAEVMQLDRDLGIRMHRRNLPVGKFDEHALDAKIEHATLTHCALPATNGYGKHLVKFN